MWGGKREVKWAAPRFLVHSLWEFVTGNVEIKLASFDIPLACPPLLAGRAELLRCRVRQ